ncbi:MAG: FtsQ-type POTRA domain-containing protein [Bdellovibrionales bacterium]|nr:FtsQ-type POTRA domain-containing protein [Bdellovibrionales bacterium]
MRQQIKAWIAATTGFFFVGMTVGGMYYTIQRNWFNVTAIEIDMDSTSQQPVLFERIKQDMGVRLRPFLGKKTWNLELGEVLTEIERDRRVKSAHVTRRFPNKLSVRILPHDPVLVLAGPQGLVYPIASDASLLPAVPPQEAPDLPLLRGKGFLKNEDWRKKVVELMSEIPREGDVSLSSISEMNYSPDAGLVLVLMKKGIQISVGEKAIRQKLKRVEKVLHYLNEHQIEGRVIDAKFSKKVVVRLRNAP